MLETDASICEMRENGRGYIDRIMVNQNSESFQYCFINDKWR
jgi:hypothetical protein